MLLEPDGRSAVGSSEDGSSVECRMVTVVSGSGTRCAGWVRVDLVRDRHGPFSRRHCCRHAV